MFSTDQYRAARERAVVVERASRGRIALTGNDRLSFLHALLTNDIAGLKKGTGTYSAYLTPQGRMISDMFVFETGERTILAVEGFVANSLTDRLNALVFSEDVQAHDISSTTVELNLVGPESVRIAERANGFADATAAIVRDDFGHVPRFIFFVARADVASMTSKLIAAGATESTDDLMEVLRIESAIPKFGVDMDTDTIPLEAGIEDRAISMTKGCYVGQEVIVRVLHRGHGRVARKLVGLLIEGDTLPRKGDRLFADGKEIGEVTSAAWSPLFKRPIALAYVPRVLAVPETEVEIAADTGRLRGRVHKLSD